MDSPNPSTPASQCKAPAELGLRLAGWSYPGRCGGPGLLLAPTRPRSLPASPSGDSTDSKAAGSPAEPRELGASPGTAAPHSQIPSFKYDRPPQARGCSPSPLVPHGGSMEHPSPSRDSSPAESPCPRTRAQQRHPLLGREESQLDRRGQGAVSPMPWPLSRHLQGSGMATCLPEGGASSTSGPRPSNPDPRTPGTFCQERAGRFPRLSPLWAPGTWSHVHHQGLTWRPRAPWTGHRSAETLPGTARDSSQHATVAPSPEGRRRRGQRGLHLSLPGTSGTSSTAGGTGCRPRSARRSRTAPGCGASGHSRGAWRGPLSRPPCKTDSLQCPWVQEGPSCPSWEFPPI